MAVMVVAMASGLGGRGEHKDNRGILAGRCYLVVHRELRPYSLIRQQGIEPGHSFPIR